MYRYLIIFIFFIFSSCCKDATESARYTLSDNEKEFIPYAVNQTIKFVHSNGFEFDVKVSDVYTKFEKTEVEHCGESYISYERKTAKLDSDIPELDISISIIPKAFDPYMDIQINRTNLHKNLIHKADYDTLRIDNHVYLDVYEFKNQMENEDHIIYPNSILYNQQYGIIKIIMTNYEEFTISQ